MFLAEAIEQLCRRIDGIKAATSECQCDDRWKDLLNLYWTLYAESNLETFELNPGLRYHGIDTDQANEWVLEEYLDSLMEFLRVVLGKPVRFVNDTSVVVPAGGFSCQTAPLEAPSHGHSPQHLGNLAATLLPKSVSTERETPATNIPVCEQPLVEVHITGAPEEPVVTVGICGEPLEPLSADYKMLLALHCISGIAKGEWIQKFALGKLNFANPKATKLVSSRLEELRKQYGLNVKSKRGSFQCLNLRFVCALPEDQLRHLLTNNLTTSRTRGGKAAKVATLPNSAVPPS